MGVDKTGEVTNSFDYTKSIEFQNLKKEHPKAEIKFDSKTNEIIWTETDGIFNKRLSAGRIPVSTEKQLKSAETKKIFDGMNQLLIDEYVEKGILIPKKKTPGKEVYTFDGKKFKELAGREATLGEIKQRYGIVDGALSGYNSIGFKTCNNTGEPRDLDSVPMSEVVGNKLIIPKSIMFRDDAAKKLGFDAES